MKLEKLLCLLAFHSQKRSTSLIIRLRVFYQYVIEHICNMKGKICNSNFPTNVKASQEQTGAPKYVDARALELVAEEK